MEVPDAFLGAVGYGYAATFGLVCSIVENVARATCPSAVIVGFNGWLKLEVPVHLNALDLPLISPYHVIILTLLYLMSLPAIFILGRVIGRRSYGTLSAVYNISMMVLSGFVCVEVLRCALQQGYGVWGNVVPSDADPSGWALTKVLWLYYVSKLFAFADTMFVVLKESANLKGLHVYYRATIPVVFLLCFQIAPEGDLYFVAVTDSLMAVIVHGYYLLRNRLAWDSYTREVLQKKKWVIAATQMLFITLNLAMSSYGLLVLPTVVLNHYHRKVYKIIIIYSLSLAVPQAVHLRQVMQKGNHDDKLPQFGTTDDVLLYINNYYCNAKEKLQ
jgi:elongation of very long chain fatty acids protein 4